MDIWFMTIKERWFVFAMSKWTIKVLLLVVRIVVYLAQPALFFFWLSLSNSQLLIINRTSLVTGFVFAILMILFLRIYGGFEIGSKKSKPIIYSMSTAIIFADFISYTVLQIMNVNDMNRAKIELFGSDFILLFFAILSQISLVSVGVHFGNSAYFKINLPKRCCLVTAEYSDIKNICKKINRFKLQYQIEECVKYDNPNIWEIIGRHQLVFFFDVPSAERSRIVEYCYSHSIGMYYVPDVYDVISNSSTRHIIDDIPLLGKEELRMRLVKRFAKRTLDLLVALPITILLSPVMLITAVAIKIYDKGPAFYKQTRLTVGGKEFKLLKFRSMIVNAEMDGIARLAQENDGRITPVGKALRRTRLDELPQLFNILSGDMSLVGPRPERPEIAEEYEKVLPEFRLRLKVKAGLTGYAQVYGKYNTEPRNKLLFDLFYIETQSVWMDLNILFKTVIVVFRRDATEEVEAGKTHAGVEVK